MLRVLFDSINQLESLQHLTLKINTPGLYPELSILSRLRTFTYDEFYPLPSLLASLSQYATGDVRIECEKRMSLNELIRFDQHLATKFTRVRVYDALSANRFESMRLVCDRFVSLNTLSIDIHLMPMTMLARCLSHLSQLVHLNMKMNIPQEQTQQLELIQVHSVRMLTLTIRSQSHLVTELLQLHEIFPKLQVLHLIHYSDRCGECEYEFQQNYRERNDNAKSKLMARLLHCMSLARQPFRRCANLHTVKLDTWDELSSLLPQGLIIPDQL